MTISILHYQLLFLFLFLTFFNSSYSQQKLKGIYIVSATTKIPVQDAFIQSDDLSFNASADENGYIGFKNLPSSINKLYISRIGFEPKAIELSTLSVSDNLSIIYLIAKVSRLEEVRVKAAACNGIFKTISDLDIHLRPINNSQEILRMVPGLFIGSMREAAKQNKYF